MHNGEVRRLLFVALPAGLAVALVSLLVATVLQSGSAGELGPAGGPHIGRDHWHATYQIIVCGVRQPPVPTWEGGVHTHGDGIIHIHPFSPAEEGRGARLVKWFEYGGGLLDESRLRIPGTPQTLENGLPCPDGSPGVLQVIVNGERLADWSEYIPQDGDRIIVVFGPPQAEA